MRHYPNQTVSHFLIRTHFPDAIILPSRIGYTTRRCGERGRFWALGEDVILKAWSPQTR